MGIIPANLGGLIGPERTQWAIYSCVNHHETMVAQGEKAPHQCPLCGEEVKPVGGIEQIELNTIAGPVLVMVGVHEGYPPQLTVRLAD